MEGMLRLGTRLIEYLKGVVKELGNVKFPDWPDVKLTVIVITIILIIMVIFVGVSDLIISKLIKTLLGIL
jgi:preprotein translocase SecE subunit